MRRKKTELSVFVWFYGKSALVAVAPTRKEARSIIREMFEEDAAIRYSPKSLEKALRRIPATMHNISGMCSAFQATKLPLENLPIA